MMGVALRCKVICRKPWRSPKITQDGSREWVTVIEMVFGDGCVLRTMIITKGKAHYLGWYVKLKKAGPSNLWGIRKGLD